MKKRLALFLAFALLVSLFGCGPQTPPEDGRGAEKEDFGGDDTSFGESLEELGAFDGYFEEEKETLTVTCISGTAGAYTLTDGVLTFTSLTEDSVYALSGQLVGSVVIDVGEAYRLDLEMRGLSLVSKTANPVYALSGDKVSLTAKKDTKNYIYDEREAVAGESEEKKAAVYAETDLEICGKGSLTLVSENNGGIHTKNDLTVKNLTLLVSCADNALKGNDGVRLESGTTTLIAKAGDGIKTTNSHISEKGNQKGSISVMGGTHTVYAACDGIDAAYDVTVAGEETSLTVYTDKYSKYSEEITATAEDVYYIRFGSTALSYSVKYYNSDDDLLWENAVYHSAVSSGFESYYYYSFPRHDEYTKMQIYLYTSDMEQGSEEEYYAATELMTKNDSYDTFALSSYGGSLGYSWTNYSTAVTSGGMGRPGMGGHGGMGGMQEGNTDKGDHSAKGIKAANAIYISGGSVSVKSYDDALHANAEGTLENGASPVGDLMVSGGTVSLYSNDDGLHADGALLLSGGSVTVLHSYEGLEGNTVVLSGTTVSVTSSDDGINATATAGTGVTVSGGRIYVYAGGDGIDVNSRTSYGGIFFEDGEVFVLSTSGGNSAIDTEQGYSYKGGYVVAVMPSGGMTSESTHCATFNAVGTQKSLSVDEGAYLTVEFDAVTLTAKMPLRLSGTVICLGDSGADVHTENGSNASLDFNGISWDK